MCNAWNHSALCRCGFGGEGHLGRSPGGYFGGYDLRTPAGRARVYTDSHVDPNARCPVCDAHVFFYQSPYGGRVYFDALGWPWPKHPCTDSRRYSVPLRATDQERLDKLSRLLRKFGLPTAMAPSATLRFPPLPPIVRTPSPVMLDFNALLTEGNQALIHGSYDLAGDYFVRALTLQPDSVPAWLGLAAVFLKSGTGMQAERNFCLVRARELAIVQGRPKVAEMANQRIRGWGIHGPKLPDILKGVDLKLPPPPIPAANPASPPVLRPVPAAVNWQLLVRTAKGSTPARWVLFAEDMRLEGSAPLDLSPQIALLTALLDGLRSFRDFSGRTKRHQLTVSGNEAIVIKQVRGEAKSHHPEHQNLLAHIVAVSKQVGHVTFMLMTSTALDKLL